MWGSLTSLNTSPQKGSFSSGFLSISEPVLGSSPCTGGKSRGDGRQRAM